MGKKKWRRYVARIVEELKVALNADYVVLGGGNGKKMKTLLSDLCREYIGKLGSGAILP
jgi:polyphosphate glucokinase